MASFTDAILQFNPYIKEIPDSLASVGMMKQMQYDKGVQQTQGMVDKLYNMAIAQPAKKEYLLQQMEQFTTALNTSLSGADFSNQALVNQISGYAGQIANDDIVQSGISDTIAMQKEQQLAEKSRQEGKDWAPENQYYLDKSIESYMAGNAKARFSGKYLPYTDVKSKLIDLWSKANPNSKLTSELQVDGSTKFVVQRGDSVETITENEVLNQLNGMLDGKDLQQLSISGEFLTKDLEAESFIKASYKANFDEIESYIRKYTAELAALPANDPTYKQTKDTLDLYEKQKKELEEAQNKSIERAKKNPTAEKTQLWANNFKMSMADFVAYRKTTSEVKLAKEWYDIQETNRQAALEANAAQPPIVAVTEPTDDVNSNAYNEFTDETKALIVDQTRKKSELIYSRFKDSGVSDENNPVYVDVKTNADGTTTTRYLMKDDPKSKAIYQQTYIKLKEKRINGEDLSLEASTYFDQEEAQELVINARTKIQADIEKEAENLIQKNPQIKSAKKKLDDALNYFKNGITVLSQERKGDTVITSSKNIEVPSELLALHSKAYEFIQTKDDRGKVDGFWKMKQNVKLTDVQLEKLKQLNEIMETSPEVKEKITKQLNVIKATEAQVNATISPIIVSKNQTIRQYQNAVNTQGRVITEKDANTYSALKATLSDYAPGLNSLGPDKIQIKTILEAFEKEGAKPTLVYYQDANNKPMVRVSHSTVNDGKPITVPISMAAAQSLKLYENDEFYAARVLLGANQGYSTGSSPQEAIPVNNPNLGKNKVRYQLRQLNPNNFKLTLYFGNGKEKRIFVDEKNQYDWASLSAALKNLNQVSIDNFFSNRSETPYMGAAPSSTIPSFSVPSNEALPSNLPKP
jgi:hypothetical protein